jgi:hypothetical protein
MLSDQDAALLKEAIQRARAAPGVAGPGATWHVINQPNPNAAVNFINQPPAQVAGEAAFSNRPDGTVDVYYFL